MRKILSSRFFRSLICLILICCFLINFSPIRSKATGLEAAAALGVAQVAAEIVVAGIFQALGVMAGSDPTIFSTQVNECVTWLKNNTSYVVSGMVQVMGFMSADGFMKSLAMKDLVQSVWLWLFDNEVVYNPKSYTANAGYKLFNSYTIYPTCNYSAITGYYSKSGNYFKCSFVCFLDGTQYYLTSTSDLGSLKTCVTREINGITYNYYAASSSVTSIASINLPYLGDFTGLNNYEIAASLISSGLGNCTSVYSDLDVALGQIQGPYNGQEIIDIEVAEIYTDYVQEIEYYEYHGDGGTDNESGGSDGSDDQTTKVPLLPIGIPSIEYDDTVIEQTQEEAQSGETELEFDFETSTDPDPGTGEPGTGTNPDSGSSGSWTPPSDMGKFTLDLKQYFPFCIPFDLYAFFTCLNAEPVAPVIEWLIPLPGGKTYPFEIDLSTFDSVAQILRRMQLLLFCVGLAFKTRDLIKG